MCAGFKEYGDCIISGDLLFCCVDQKKRLTRKLTITKEDGSHGS